MYTYKKQRRAGSWTYAIIAVIVLVVYAAWALGRSLPELSPSLNTGNLSAQTAVPTIHWPSQGQSAVGIVGTSLLNFHGAQQPVPTASTAKLITALTVLQQKPLQPGQQGPVITLTANDVALYNHYVSEDGSLVKVVNGEQISEYQMLQTMMLPSANNMADSLAIWAFGSLNAYAEAANQYLESEGLVETHVGSDASGLNPSTTSTARDLVRIGELVMKDPVLSQIVGQSSASGIPVVGTIKNVNSLLGTDGIIGIKTGNSDQAGGVFVSASRVKVNGKPVTIVTALAGSSNLWQALHDSLPLVTSAQSNFERATAIKAGSVVAEYKLPWGGRVQAVATDNLTLQAWGGSTTKASAHLQKISSNARAGQVVGSATVPNSNFNDQLSTEVKLQTSPSQPSAWWRLTHPI